MILNAHMLNTIFGPAMNCGDGTRGARRRRGWPYLYHHAETRPRVPTGSGGVSLLVTRTGAPGDRTQL